MEGQPGPNGCGPRADCGTPGTGALLEQLRHPDYRVRIDAAGRLGSAGDIRFRAPLVGVASNRGGERPEVRVAALRALGSLMEPGDYAGMLEGFINGESRKVMTAARKLLKASDPGGYSGRLARAGCLDHSAMKVYSSSRDPAAADLISGFLEERLESRDVIEGRHWGRVYTGVKALHRIGGTRGAGVIREISRYTARIDPRELKPLERERLAKIAGAVRGAL